MSNERGKKESECIRLKKRKPEKSSLGGGENSFQVILQGNKTSRIVEVANQPDSVIKTKLRPNGCLSRKKIRQRFI